MVGTRHLQGTIISRVEYLLESGSLKKPPIWYDIVRRFPPPKTSVLSLVGNVDETEVAKISYPVDDVKREFHKQFERANRDPVSLIDEIPREETKTDLFLRNYHWFIKEGCVHTEAMEKASELFIAHLKSLRNKKSTQQLHEQESTAHGDINQEDSTNVDLHVDDIYKMFSTNSRKNEK